MDKDNIMPLNSLDSRIPYWDNNGLIQRACPICSSQSAINCYMRPDKLLVKKCCECQAHYVSPAPDEEQLRLFYSTYHAKHFESGKKSRDEVLAELNSSHPFDDIRIRKISCLFNINTSKVLDIGCGKGVFLYQLKRLGASVSGIEIDEDAAAIAKTIVLNSIHVGTIDSFNTSDEFDLIILNDIIEHPLAPIDLLNKSLRFLKKGGYVLIWTPNGDRIEMDIEKTTLRVDLEHLQYLGAPSLKMIANNLLLTIVHYEAIGYPSLAAIRKNESIFLLLKNLAKKNLKKTPFFNFGNRIRKLINSYYMDKSGDYHIFCILKK
jgi:2-polyprenyl-3-methyl-5-hydroxy-6-metoxy-1,4-benzoquinol methylase